VETVIAGVVDIAVGRHTGNGELWTDLGVAEIFFPQKFTGIHVYHPGASGVEPDVLKEQGTITKAMVGSQFPMSIEGPLCISCFFVNGQYPLQE